MVQWDLNIVVVPCQIALKLCSDWLFHYFDPNLPVYDEYFLELETKIRQNFSWTSMV